MTKPDFANSVLKSDEFEKFCEKHGYTLNRVITSRDFEADKETFAISRVAADGLIDPQFSEQLADGSPISKTVLPFSFIEGSTLVYVYAPPNQVVKEHSHTRGFVRFVTIGEYTFTGLPQGEVRMTTGDWIYIPKGQPYGYRAGPYGGGGGCCYCTNGR